VDLQSGLRRNGLTLVEKTSKGDILLVDALKPRLLEKATQNVFPSTKLLVCPLLKNEVQSAESEQKHRE
jgi:hypothetical protein